MKKFISLLMIFVLTLLAVESCVPSKEAYEEEILPADRLIKKLEAKRRKVKTFKGTGVFSVESPKLNAKAGFEVKLKKPDSLQFAIYGPFGIDLAYMLVTKNDYVFYDVLKSKAYKGALRDEIIRKLFHVNISFDDLLDAFTGAVNLTDKLRREPDEYSVNEEYYTLTFLDSLNNKKSIYNVLINTLAITDYRLAMLDGKNIFESKFSDFKTYLRNVPIPRNTHFVNLDKNQTVDISYRRIEVNKKIDKMTFPIPEDVKITEW